MKLTIFGQTPSKKSSQQMIATKLGQKFVEEWRKKLIVMLMDLKEKGVLCLPEKGDAPIPGVYLIKMFDEFLTQVVKGVRSSSRNILLPNKKYVEWEKGAIYQLEAQKEKLNLQTIEEPVNVASVIYRLTKRRVDGTNLRQSVHDVLERAGILKNDFLIETTNGSRRILGVEKGQERVDIYITKADPF